MSKLAAAGLSRTVAGPQPAAADAAARAPRSAGPAARPSARTSRAIASARRTASSRSAAASVRARPAARKLAPRPGPLSPIRTAATARSATTGARARRSIPLSRPPAIRTIGGSNARSAAITASGWVPCESLTNRTPSTSATGSRRCSTPVNAAAASRMASGASPNRSPTAIAARALETLWAPGMASSPTGMMRPPGPVAAGPPPATGSRSTPAATIQPSTTPMPPGIGRSRR